MANSCEPAFSLKILMFLKSSCCYSRQSEETPVVPAATFGTPYDYTEINHFPLS